MTCEVYDNCQKNYDCDFCVNYGEYYPRIKKILSPRQKEAREMRKIEKHERKNSEASKRGKANRASGRRAEKTLEKMFQSWSLPCSRVPMSGALKGVNLIGVPDDILQGDLRVEINGGIRKVESKKRATGLKTFYKMTENNVVHYPGFYFVMNEEDFKHLVTINRVGEVIELEATPSKKLISFFTQDNVDIVAMREGRLKWIFAVTDKLMGELLK